MRVAGLVSDASLGVRFPRLSQSNEKADRSTESQLPLSAQLGRRIPAKWMTLSSRGPRPPFPKRTRHSDQKRIILHRRHRVGSTESVFLRTWHALFQGQRRHRERGHGRGHATSLLTSPVTLGRN